MNKIVLIGRLVRDPDLRYTQNGTAVCNFTLAVESNYKKEDGDRDVDFIKIVAWRKLGETCANHLGKGRLIAVSGKLKKKKNESDNKTYINPEVIANEVKFLDWPDNDSNNNSEQNNSYNDEDETVEDNYETEDDFDVPF